MLEKGAGIGPPVAAREGRRLPGDVARGRLHLYHLGAQVREQPPTKGGGEKLAPLDDGQTLEEADIRFDGWGRERSHHYRPYLTWLA